MELLYLYRYFYKPVAQNVQKTVMNWKECTVRTRKQLWLNLRYRLKLLPQKSAENVKKPSVKTLGIRAKT